MNFNAFCRKICVCQIFLLPLHPNLHLNAMNRLFILIMVALFCCVGHNYAQTKREMRAAWIATVANIDWPSKQAQGNSAKQQAEMTAMLDSLHRIGINMVVFQVRPTADAFYHSDLEPWSNWLTGKQGRPNDTDYDPLQFVCAEAHKRCMDVHVWLNPYRVTNGFDISELAPAHIYKQHPDWFVRYGKQWYFNPGLDETRQFLNRVVADIVERYEVDGIHFDDYFYPYRIAGEEFPDAATFRKYPRGFTNKDDWRRNNVNMVIQELHQTIRERKPWVEFGISPFGVWRNQSTDSIRGSRTQAGCQNYDDLYADILLWLEKGWIDYVVPQLYWEIGKRVADYEILVHWWAEHSYGQNLYVGHSTSGLGSQKGAEAWRRPNEICRQIALNHSVEGVDGSVFFPAHTLLENKLGLCDSLTTNYYQYPALQPICRNINGLRAYQPTHLHIDEDDMLTWKDYEGDMELEAGQDAVRYVVYAFESGKEADFDDPRNIVGITAEKHMQLHLDPMRYTICVTAVNSYHHESLPAVVE